MSPLNQFRLQLMSRAMSAPSSWWGRRVLARADRDPAWGAIRAELRAAEQSATPSSSVATAGQKERMWAAIEQALPPPASAPPTRTGWWVPAMAAAGAVAVLFVLQTGPDPDDGWRPRGGPQDVVEVVATCLAPSGAALDRASFGRRETGAVLSCPLGGLVGVTAEAHQEAAATLSLRGPRRGEVATWVDDFALTPHASVAVPTGWPVEDVPTTLTAVVRTPDGAGMSLYLTVQAPPEEGGG